MKEEIVNEKILFTKDASGIPIRNPMKGICFENTNDLNDIRSVKQGKKVAIYNNELAQYVDKIIKETTNH